MTTTTSRRLNILPILLSGLYNNAEHPVLCECWRFTDMWKTLAMTAPYQKDGAGP